MKLSDPETIYLVIGFAIGLASLSFIFALYLTRRSKADAKRAIRTGLKEIEEVTTAGNEQVVELDRVIIDTLFKLSPAAGENFSLAKQFLSLMENRRNRVEELTDSGRLEDLFMAAQVITAPLENAGDHLSSLVFATTILHLNPGEYGEAIEALLNSIQNELDGKPAVKYFRGIDESGHRRRKFTIRSFLNTMSGKEL